MTNIQMGALLEDHLTEEQILALMDRFSDRLKALKPNDRSEKDRIYAMCITHLQEAAALFDRHVVRA